MECAGIRVVRASLVPNRLSRVSRRSWVSGARLLGSLVAVDKDVETENERKKKKRSSLDCLRRRTRPHHVIPHR